MNIKISPNILHGEIDAISSKSYAHRALICAALSSGQSRIYCTDLSEDIKTTVNCLVGMGAKITYSDNLFLVSPIDTTLAKQEIDCGESGSTLRFILPIICALGLNMQIKMHGRLSKRPLSPLVEELCEKGCKIHLAGDVLHVEGKLQPGDFTIAGNVSSQFISGLLFALPLLGEKCRIVVTGKFESFSYVKLTLAVLKQFGIDIELSDNVFEVENKEYISKDIVVEGDWSNAAFWLCAGALSDKGITVKNLNMNSVQGDSKILDVLARFGADVVASDNQVTVKKGELNGITIDANDIPDLVPIICVLATSAKGKTTITNAARLRIKESDRIKTVVELITSLGGKIEETQDGMIVYESVLSGGIVDSNNDHRIAMSAAIASCLCENEVVINDATAVNKSYPRFFDDFNKLNGKAKEM